MVDGFTHPRNQFTTPALAIGVGEDELGSADGSLLIQRLGWLAAVFAVVVQQGAFVSSPVLSNLVAQIGSPDAQANILNTLAVSLNITLLVPLCLLHYRQLAPVIYGNKAAVALIIFIFLSMAWSIHPDVTIRRSFNYFSTMLTAFYLAARFDVAGTMKILSWGVAISVVGSFLFVAAFPLDAIHQPSSWQVEEQIAGAWRGVFSHKNVFGHAMTVGVFAQLYILISTKTKTIWHVLLLCGCVALVILSRSSTAVLITTLYMLGASLAFLLQRARQYFGVGLAMFAVLVATIATIYWIDSDFVFGVIGRDATFSGRTELWALVRGLISERPLLGWGYGAMWVPSDTITIAISEAVGWGSLIPSAHNALLEVTLEMGFAGLAIVISFVAVSLWRSARCLAADQQTLGILALVFFVGVIISGTSEPALAQNQSIEWVVFNALSFTCGIEIMRRRTPERDRAPAVAR